MYDIYTSNDGIYVELRGKSLIIHALAPDDHVRIRVNDNNAILALFRVNNRLIIYEHENLHNKRKIRLETDRSWFSVVRSKFKFNNGITYVIDNSAQQHVFETPKQYYICSVRPNGTYIFVRGRNYLHLVKIIPNGGYINFSKAC